MEEKEFEQGSEVIKRGTDERILLEAVCQHMIRVTHKLQQYIHRRIRSVRLWYWSLANRVPNIRGKPWKLQIERNEKVEVFSRLFNVRKRTPCIKARSSAADIPIGTSCHVTNSLRHDMDHGIQFEKGE
jgi:hypothetical protein